MEKIKHLLHIEVRTSTNIAIVLLNANYFVNFIN